MVIEPLNFKVFPSLRNDYHTSEIQNIAIPTKAFSPHNLKILTTLHIEIFWIGNPAYFFFGYR